MGLDYSSVLTALRYLMDHSRPQSTIFFEKIDSYTSGMGASGVASNAYIPEFNTATATGATADPSK